DGSGAKPLTLLNVPDSDQPAWSADGGRIAFHSIRALDGRDADNTNSTGNLWVMNADGSGATPLTRLTALGTGTEAPASRPSFMIPSNRPQLDLSLGQADISTLG